MKAQRKKRTGVVVSNRMDKTIVVATQRMTKHSLYKKYIKKRVKVKAHDKENSCQIGDTVIIQETRPISRDKRWTVVEILQRAV